MRVHKFFARTLAATGVLLLSLMTIVATASAAPVASTTEGQYLVVADPSSTSVNANLLRSHGHQVLDDMSQAGVFLVSTRNPTDLKTLPGVLGVTQDNQRRLIPNEDVSIF